MNKPISSLSSAPYERSLYVHCQSIFHNRWRTLEAYEEDKKRHLGADSLIPKRIKFQKFGR
jgi:hypothetical protein